MRSARRERITRWYIWSTGLPTACGNAWCQVLPSTSRRSAPEELLGGAVHVGHAPVAIVGDEAFEHALEVIAGALDDLARLELRRDVARDAARMDELAILPLDVRGDAHVPQRAVARAHARGLVA